MDSTTVSGAGNVCTQCGSKNLDIDPVRGDTICTNCGMVLQDTYIVSDVQFSENAQGGSSVIGQFVSGEGTGGTRPSHPLGAFHQSISRESREVTLEKGRKYIAEVGHQLKLNQHCIDTAFNFYKLAVSKGLTRGRRKKHVVAACLYLVCRTEGTPHMLLDFSDLLQVNMFDLGKAYNHLASKLCINLPTLDPCLYIHRFANQLQFAESDHAVSMSALRILQRMKRDWMAQGRRPSGLCGAALLVAARMHNFNRTVKDVIKVVKISEMTIRKRLSEFEKTPSSSLTIEEFNTIDLEEEMDPPCFTEGRTKEKQKVLEEQGNISDISAEIARLQGQIEAALEETTRKYSKHIAKKREAPTAEELEEELIKSGNFINVETLENLFKNETETKPKNEEEAQVESVKRDVLTSKSTEGLGLSDPIKECLKDEDKTVQETDGQLDLDGISDTEIDNYILDDFEMRTKAKLWLAEHADYLKQQKEKEDKLREKREQEGLKPEKKKRKRKSRNQTNHAAPTAGEAIEKMLQEKKISSKINYDVLRDLDKVAPLTDAEANGLAKQSLPEEVKQETKPSNLSMQKNRFSKPTLLSNIQTQSTNQPTLAESPLKKPKIAQSSDEEIPEEEEEDIDEEQPVSALELLGTTNFEGTYDEEFIEDEDDM